MIEFSPLEQHTHNGIDSQKMNSKNLLGVLDTKVNYDPSNIVSGSAITQNFTVAGARMKDFVLVSAPYDLQGIQITGYVSTTNIVTLALSNGSANAVNLGAGTAWIIKVIKL